MAGDIDAKKLEEILDRGFKAAIEKGRLDPQKKEDEIALRQNTSALLKGAEKEVAAYIKAVEEWHKHMATAKETISPQRAKTYDPMYAFVPFVDVPEFSVTEENGKFYYVDGDHKKIGEVPKESEYTTDQKKEQKLDEALQTAKKNLDKAIAENYRRLTADKTIPDKHIPDSYVLYPVLSAYVGNEIDVGINKPLNKFRKQYEKEILEAKKTQNAEDIEALVKKLGDEAAIKALPAFERERVLVRFGNQIRVRAKEVHPPLPKGKDEKKEPPVAMGEEFHGAINAVRLAAANYESDGSPAKPKLPQRGETFLKF